MQQDTGMRKILLPLLTILLAACNLPRFISDVEPFTVASTPEIVTNIPAILTDTPGATAGYTECGWIWATQSLPDLSANVQSALDAAGLKGVTVYAETYGENCLTGSGKVDHFAAMETDFHFQAKVSDLANLSTLGDLLERILVVLDGFPRDSTPGPQPGYIGVRFIHGTDELNLWFERTASDLARSQGLHAADLLRELQKK
jgi:hypothetical protein